MRGECVLPSHQAKQYVCFPKIRLRETIVTMVTIVTSTLAG